MTETSDPGKGTRPHKAGGHTFHSRRAKMAMERESNKPKPPKPKPRMFDSISDVLSGKP